MLTKYMPKESRTISYFKNDNFCNKIDIQLDPMQRWEIVEELDNNITLKLDALYVCMTKDQLNENFNPIMYYEYGTERDDIDQLRLEVLRKSIEVLENHDINNLDDNQRKMFEIAVSNATTCINYMMVSKHLMDDMVKNRNIFEDMIKEEYR